MNHRREIQQKMKDGTPQRLIRRLAFNKTKSTLYHRGSTETIDKIHILVMLASKDGYDHRLVRETLQVTVKQGRLREGNEGNIDQLKAMIF